MSAARPDLLHVFASQQAQAPKDRDPYLASVPAEDGMLRFLAGAAKTAREAAGRKQVHIAAEADKDQSAIYRFEKADGWPRNPDEIIRAYAADLEIEAIELWARALELWREAATARDEASGLVPGLADVHTQKTSKPAQTAERSEPSRNPTARRLGSR